ncbi:Lactonase, 7-bladed beta-propeller-domain-containing protein [Mycena alexandri]|uniref:Lactonase, 7-bladed beta-propeller-domain-containing protein n=1 Tax=Mycena alexandri TaxID=1745969 RepID=A0AAD6X9T5_9AGAR|nr:Lactonase, 7-bladed beta-propeller-domain-containing protein [Mycena alexandri]
MVAFTIFAGGYDVFIAAYLFNTADSSLTLTGQYPSGANPSWITGHPTNKSILYATNENIGGALQSFDISGNVLSSPIETVASEGDNPAFAVALSTGEVAILNYSSGNGRIIPTTTSPEHFDNNSAPVITFPPIAASGGVSHPHMALQHGTEVFVSDLGGDMIWRLSRSGGPGVYSITGQIPQPLGSGPRHLRISNERLYVLHELASTLTVQAIPAAPNGTSSIISTASIIPTNPPPPAGAVWAAAEILIPPPSARFPKQYIYVSNRNTGVQAPSGDSIAIFENVDQGTRRERLQLVAQVFTGLDQIRGMEFGGEGDEYLIAGGFAGTAGVVIYRRADGGRGLQEVVRNAEVPTRTSFVWRQSS